MIVKYKVTDFAKDTGLSVKKILDTLTQAGIKDKKNSSTLEEKELNLLLDRLSSQNSEADLSAFLNSARPEPKAAPAPAAKNGQKGAGSSGGAKQGAKQQPAEKHKPAPQAHKKRDEKTVSLSELGRETGTKALPPNRCRSSARTTR